MYLSQTLMKHILTIMCILALVFAAGCGQEQQPVEEQTNETTEEMVCTMEYAPICGEDGLTYQNSCFSSLRNIGVEHLGECEYTACSFNGQEHYMMNNMMYYEDNLNRPYINVLYGTFRLQADEDGWAYVKAINKESSYYSNRMIEYQQNITESGNPIACKTTTDAPEQLKEFLKTHGKILELKIEGYNITAG